MAIDLARVLDKVHDAGIIHGGIKPHNILVDDELNIGLIDFISAIDVGDVSHFIYELSFIRETLAYTSPEQTGRINHKVSFSSDLYSLGIVFYEMLTGHLPFSSRDPLELIHSHLAEEAPKVHELNPEIPITLSKIVSKLMLKEPEKRYQSSNGLFADLARCQDEYLTIGTITEFPLERYVNTRRVNFISKMVGRVQVFQNLVGNAIKYREKKTPQIHISAKKEGENWLFKVEDNGIGIDPQYFERVFLIFKRLHTNDEYSGTGIGLAITKRIIERHGGDIWVDSELGNGSKFYFNLPFKD